MSDTKDISGTDAQRIDKWLWCARIFKTRSLAAKFVTSDSLRLTRSDTTQRITKASFLVRPDDQLAFSIGDRLRILKINGCASRRGPAVEAQTLYEDCSPPPPPKEKKPTPIFEREKGSGRPTKKDRRDLQRLKSSE